MRLSSNQKNKKHFFLQLLSNIVTPAYGCTEIGCVALCSSIAAEHLKGGVIKAEVHVSSYIYRNDANVGVPNLGQCGIGTIAAAGFIVKQSRKKLSVLSKLTPTQVRLAKKLGCSKAIKVVVEKHVNPVYCRVIATDKFNTCEVLIERKHDAIKRIKVNNKLIHIRDATTKNKLIKYKYDVNDISLNDIYNFVKKLTIKEVSFLKRGLVMNNKVAERGFRNPDSLINVARTVSSNVDLTKWRDHLVSVVVSAVDARMSGCPLPVMASNNSGDHGLTVELPQLFYYYEKHTTELTMLQAVAFANLITWKIKKNIGDLSAYCGSVVASVTATLCGLGYQRNYSIKKINDLINLCLCAWSGLLCDGAKISCAWKIESALISGFAAMEIVEHGTRIPGEGINNDDAFETIKDLGKLSHAIMNETNSVVVDIINKNDKYSEKQSRS